MTRCTRPGCYWRAEYTIDGELVCRDHATTAIDALTHETRIAPLTPALQEINA